MKLQPLNAEKVEASSPRYPTRQGWRQRQNRWLRGALAAAGASAVLWAGGCRTPGEPVPPRIEETRTAGTPQAVDPQQPIKPPEGETTPEAAKPPEADAGPTGPVITRTAGIPQQIEPQQIEPQPIVPSPPEQQPPVAPAPPAPVRPSARLSGDVATPAYPVR